MLKLAATVLLIVLVVFVAPVLLRAALWYGSERPGSWSSADWSSSGLLPSARDA